VLAGERPARPPTERAVRFRWSSVTDRVESVYERVANA
jgi:hypothetical protein